RSPRLSHCRRQALSRRARVRGLSGSRVGCGGRQAAAAAAGVARSRAALSPSDDRRRGDREERAAGGFARVRRRPMTGGRRARAVPFWVVEAIVLAALGFLALALYEGFSDWFVLDCDVANLAMSIERFTVFEHQPHPPGYLGYVVLLKLVHAVTHMTPLEV